MDHIFDLVNFLMNAFNMLSIGIEDDLFFNVISIDIDIFILVGLLQ